jgi:hypothetical protein
MRLHLADGGAAENYHGCCTNASRGRSNHCSITALAPARSTNDRK